MPQRQPHVANLDGGAPLPLPYPKQSCRNSTTAHLPAASPSLQPGYSVRFAVPSLGQGIAQHRQTAYGQIRANAACAGLTT
jgi:hypothetical protein